VRSECNFSNIVNLCLKDIFDHDTGRKKILAAELKQQILSNFAKIENLASKVDSKMETLRKNVNTIKTDINETLLTHA
jgi:hypothetical protein